MGTRRQQESRPRRSAARSSDERDALGRYLDAIRPIPVLSREDATALASRRARHEAIFRRAMCALPATAIAAVTRWSERKLEGFVTGVLAAGYREARGRDWSSGIDEFLSAVAVMLDRRSALGRRRDPDAQRERAALAREIARRLEGTDLAPELLIELCRDFEALAAAPGAARCRRLRLHTRGSRARLEHARRALAARDAAARRLAQHNLKLVVKFAKRYRGLGVPFLDLIQEGNLGVLRAAEKFDPERGFSFSTYGVWWIEQALVRAVQNQSRTVRVPAHVYDRQLRYREAARSLRQSRGREPTRRELAAALALDPEDVELVVATTRPIRSTNEPVPGSDSLCLEDLIPDEGADAVETIERREVRHALDGALLDLRPRERQILEWRFGLSGDRSQTLEEIGVRMGVSRERVRQIQAAALARLRHREGIAALASAIGLRPEAE